MHPKIFLALFSILLALSLVTSGCGVTINIAFATPSITPIIATSIPVGIILPTITPLPVLPSATIAPATATAVASATPQPSVATSTSQPPTPTSPPPTQTPQPPTQTLQPPPPPPPQPTQVVLPQLKIYDKDGNNMDGQVKGISVPKSLMSFQVIACVPDCKSKSDGTGVTSVDFLFYKIKTQSRDDLNGKNPVYKTTEHNKPYCAFGGDNPCPNWIFSDHGGKWPNGANIDSGDYTLLLRANGDNKNNAFWTSVVNFTIQR